MILTSWNVNGLRAALKNGFLDWLQKTSPDVCCIQETRIHDDHVPKYLPQIRGYHFFWNSAQKRGYSGVATLSKIKPLHVLKGIQMNEHDAEGRVLTLEFLSCYVVNVYVPNAQRGLTRLSYRTQWDKDFLAFLKKLEKHKPILVCGDFNVAHKEVDLKNPQANKKNAGFTPEERAGFDKIISAGFVDTFREFERGPGHYTWWTYRFQARKKNIGWRIDYALISASLQKNLRRAFILSDVLGSDHCPVGIEITL